MTPEVGSATARHILNVLHAGLKPLAHGRIVRVLDVGCGDGRLIAYLMERLVQLNPSCTFDVYGFDVHDHGVQLDGYFEGTVRALRERFPRIPWETRLTISSARKPWPYPDGFFDVILSNQVIEHVQDHDLFFAEIGRTMRVSGFSVHVFPLRECLIEPHLHLPLVHKIRDRELLVFSLRCLSRLGLGTFRSHRKHSGVTLGRFAEEHADYLSFFTNYRSYREVLKLAKKHALQATFRYTPRLYTGKLRAVTGLTLRDDYSRRTSPLVDWGTTHVVKYLASVTLLLRKDNTYGGNRSDP